MCEWEKVQTKAREENETTRWTGEDLGSELIVRVRSAFCYTIFFGEQRGEILTRRMKLVTTAANNETHNTVGPVISHKQKLVSILGNARSCCKGHDEPNRSS